VDGINAAIATIREKLPAVRVLTAAARQQLFKMRDRRAGFVQNARNAADNPLVQAVLPPSFDRAKFDANAGLTATLIEIRNVIEQLASDVDDTTMAVGSNTVNAAAKLYGYVKAGAEDNPGLKPIAEQLGEAFKRANAKPHPAKPLPFYECGERAGDDPGESASKTDDTGQHNLKWVVITRTQVIEAGRVDPLA
jgi:hypothetical protein